MTKMKKNNLKFFFKISQKYIGVEEITPGFFKFVDIPLSYVSS